MYIYLSCHTSLKTVIVTHALPLYQQQILSLHFICSYNMNTAVHIIPIWLHVDLLVLLLHTIPLATYCILNNSVLITTDTIYFFTPYSAHTVVSHKPDSSFSIVSSICLTLVFTSDFLSLYLLTSLQKNKKLSK